MKNLPFLLLLCYFFSGVKAQSNVSVNVNSYAGCAPQQVDINFFEANAVNYQVFISGNSFSQSATTSNTSLSVTIPYGGSYSVFVYALDQTGNWYDYNSNQFFIQGLDASPFYSNISQIACPGDEISFWLNGYFLNTPAITDWNLGNGTTFSQLPEYSTVNTTYADTGTYIISVSTTFPGCPTVNGTDTFFVANSPNILPTFETFIFPNDSVCPNNTVEVIGPYYYNLNFDFGDGNYSNTSGAHQYLVPGNYPVSVTAVNGCGNAYTVLDTIHVGTNLPYNEYLDIYVSGLGGDSVICPNTNLIFYASTYSANSLTWNFGNNDITNSQNPTREFFTTGIKNIVLTATNGCGNSKTISKNIYVVDTIHPSSIFVSMADSICPGTPINLYVDVPNAPYSDNENYNYNFGDTSWISGSEATHIYTTSGNFTFNVSYTNGCGNSISYSQPVYVGLAAGTQPFIDFEALNEVCPGDTALFISYPAGGNISYQIDFGDGSAPSSSYENIVADGLLYNIYKHVYTTAGNYSATLTYSSACGGQQTVVAPIPIVNNAEAYAGFFYDEEKYHCLGDAVEFFAFGGSAYDWDFGDGTGILQTSASLVPVTHAYQQPGLYKVKVSAYNSCGSKDSSHTYINIPDSKINIITNQIASNCGVADGKAIAIATGGTLPYTYEWTNGDQYFIADSIMAGIYSVTVKDKNGCSNYAIATVSDQQAPTILVNNIINASCNNGNDGVIDISVVGSTGPYSFQWSNGKTSEDINNLVAGPYEVIVTDANGCKATKSIYVDEPDPFFVSFTSQMPSCGSNNGILTANVLGTSAPYYFVWSNGANSATNTGLAAGIYNLVVVDSKGCLKQISAVLNNLDGPVVLIDSVLPLNCNAGGASIYVTGAGNGINYNWTNGNSIYSTADISGIGIGTYSLTVTDTNGCVTSRVVDITSAIPEENPICLVTVDTTTFTNKVIWETGNQTGISSYNIYRESSLAGLYYQIANVSADSLGEYIDPVADPSIKPWRYKITAVNDCGEESERSSFHKTIHLTVNKGLTDSTYNLIWDDYIGKTGYSTFNIWRYTNLDGWKKIDSVSALDHSYTDYVNGFSVLTDLFYNVEAGPLSVCDPARSLINTSRSNIKQIIASPVIDSTVGISHHNLVDYLIVYPNPSKGLITLAGNADNREMEIEVSHLLGGVLKRETTTKEKHTISLEEFSNGVYFVRVKIKDELLVKKIIISK